MIWLCCVFLLIALCALVGGEDMKRRYLEQQSVTNTLVANNTRFTPIPRDQIPKKDANLLLFISITSSPQHAHLRHANRFTWLLPCIASPVCDYRFFIDKAKESSTDLFGEQSTYEDMLFRDSCDLMKRHPDSINYGNAPPREESLLEHPDYLWRRLYKVDWKVCFMRYARDNGKMAEFHAFVEDDSFVCMENLLHQANLLLAKSSAVTIPPPKMTKGGEDGRAAAAVVFRTGTGMFDGFDDSSTFMTKEVAMAFADHYGEEGINCTHVVDHIHSTAWNSSMWLSWGNSWMALRCDWAAVLRRQLNLHVLKPQMDCFAATSLNVSKHITTLAFHCSDHQVVMHHGTAGELLLRAGAPHARHTCEYMLLIDKVKEPSVMYDLWNVAAVEHEFHDYSEIFLHEGDAGWLRTLEVLAAEEEACVSKKGKDPSVQDCLFETPRRLLQQRRQRQRRQAEFFLGKLP
jgi:hypothetical protein